MERRGQTLVLFALSLLLLTLMVVMTIGIGVRVHERQEQQIVADAAAYSQAVLTARTFNSIAATNRVLVAQMASVAAAQSLLSWTVFYHGVLNQARDVLTAMEGNAACGGPARWGDAKTKIVAEDHRLITLFEPHGSVEGVEGQDVISADYIRRDLYHTAILISDYQKLLYRYTHDELVRPNGKTVAQRFAEEARKGSPWASSNQELYATGGRRGQVVTARELRQVVARTAGGSVRQTWPLAMVQVTMATRGVENFTSSRAWTSESGDSSAATFIKRRIDEVIAPTTLDFSITITGTSYYSNAGPQGDPPGGPAEIVGLDGMALKRPLWNRYYRDLHDAREGEFRPWGAWAQDSGIFTFTAEAGCNVSTPTEDAFGYLISTNASDPNDEHMWRRGNLVDYKEYGGRDPVSLGTVPRQHWPDKRHTFLGADDPRTGSDPDTGRPNMWPAFVDFNSQRLDAPRADEDVYGQPKSLVNIRRNYAQRPTQDPWELRFRFNMMRDGNAGTLFDSRDQQNGIARSTALASGLTYYHRGPHTSNAPDHSKEPPNFLNPFWRATLAASDVDERGNRRGKDVVDTLRNDLNEGTQADALELLLQEGFEALP